MVAIAGQTFTGEDDEIQEIHDWLDDYEKKTGVAIPMHIDGASGAFVNPFLYPDYKMGLPASACSIHQRLGPQIRPGAARSGLGRVQGSYGV